MFLGSIGGLAEHISWQLRRKDRQKGWPRVHPAARSPTCPTTSDVFRLHTTSSLWVLGNTPDSNQGSTQPTTGPSASLWLHPTSHGRVLPLLQYPTSVVRGKGRGENTQSALLILVCKVC